MHHATRMTNLKLPCLHHGSFYKSIFFSWASPCDSKPGPHTGVHLDFSQSPQTLKCKNVQTTCPSLCKHHSNNLSLKSPDSSNRLSIKSASAVICCPPPDEVCKLVTRGQSSPDNPSMTREASCILESGNKFENKLCQHSTMEALARL